MLCCGVLWCVCRLSMVPFSLVNSLTPETHPSRCLVALRAPAHMSVQQYDNCFAGSADIQQRYAAMRDALNATGRPILCVWMALMQYVHHGCCR